MSQKTVPAPFAVGHRQTGLPNTPFIMLTRRIAGQHSGWRCFTERGLMHLIARRMLAMGIVI